MTTLHDRLADLAEDAPDALPVPGLWDRGVRYRRRRRAGTAVVLAVAVAAFALLGSVTWLRSPRAVEPLPASSPPALPDRLYAPSPWLPSTEDTGPLGPVAAVVGAVRGSWSGVGEQLQPVGVSAVTGEYRFLELPGLVADTWTLAPDGRRVAYLYRSAGADLANGIASGLAVYDAVDGTVLRHSLPGDLGVTAERPIWAGDDTVVLSYGTVTNVEDGGIGSSVSERPIAWSVGEPGPRVLTDFPGNQSVVAAGPGFLVANNFGDVFKVADLATGAVLREFRLDGDRGWFPAVLDDGAARVAVMTGDRTPNWFFAGSTTPATVQLSKVTDVRWTFKLVAWADDEHVAVTQRQTAGRPEADVGLVDVTTGESAVVVHDVPFDIQLATGLLDQPTTDAVEPPRPVDPRKATGLGVGIVLAAGLALISWRRRVRP